MEVRQEEMRQTERERDGERVCVYKETERNHEDREEKNKRMVTSDDSSCTL